MVVLVCFLCCPEAFGIDHEHIGFFRVVCADCFAAHPESLGAGVDGGGNFEGAVPEEDFVEEEALACTVLADYCDDAEWVFELAEEGGGLFGYFEFSLAETDELEGLVYVNVGHLNLRYY